MSTPITVGSTGTHLRAEYAPRAAAAETPEAFYDVLRELIAQLGDDHTRYESPREVAEQQDEFEGDLRYAGIGAIVRELDEGGLITKIARGGPADEAGLRSHDLILAVGGIPFTDTARFGPGGPISVVRGSPGSIVRLTIQSPGEGAREVDLDARGRSTPTLLRRSRRSAYPVGGLVSFASTPSMSRILSRIYGRSLSGYWPMGRSMA